MKIYSQIETLKKPFILIQFHYFKFKKDLQHLFMAQNEDIKYVFSLLFFEFRTTNNEKRNYLNTWTQPHAFCHLISDDLCHFPQ